MAGQTLADVQEMKAAWWAAYLAVSKGQIFWMNGRNLTRTDAGGCYREWQRMCALETQLLRRAEGRGRHNPAVARFNTDV